MGNDAVKTWPGLLKVSIEQPLFQDRAFYAIDRIGTPPKDQIKGIYVFFKDISKNIKMKILNVFEKETRSLSFYVPYIVTFLSDEDKELKQSTRNLLSKIGKQSNDIIADFITLLNFQRKEIVSRAVYELIKF